MDLKGKILHPSVPVTFFEMVPPPVEKPESLERAVEEAAQVGPLVDALNVPEIHDEQRGTKRTHRFIERLAPRIFAGHVRRKTDVDIVINRCVVYERDQMRWFHETQRDFGLDCAVLVGGESSGVRYPGPSVLEAAEQVRAAELPVCLGGISIPSRLHEAERIRRKQAAGIRFFTTQVLFDSNDIVGLVQQLNGLEARIFLSFVPVSHPRDLEVLRWLGADVPADLDRFLLHGGDGGPETSLARSLNLAQRILMDVFDSLPPDPPLIGLNVEHINRRNFPPAVRMLERLGPLYENLVAAHARARMA